MKPFPPIKIHWPSNNDVRLIGMPISHLVRVQEAFESGELRITPNELKHRWGTYRLFEFDFESCRMSITLHECIDRDDEMMKLKIRHVVKTLSLDEWCV